MAATCMAVCKGSRKKIRGIFISSCHLPVAVECDIVILSEPGPIPQAPVGQFCRHNLSPRGDGNGCSDYRRPNRTQLIPARGRKPVRRDNGFRTRGTQLIPARGRKHSIYPYYYGPDRHNLSPRGDGNCMRRGSRRYRMTQLIPARGRKPGNRARRKGIPGHNLSPRGDGNGQRLYVAHFGLDTTYPREGTETLCSVKSLWINSRHNLSPRGDGN